VSKLEYSIIVPIKESDKGNIYLAKMEGYEFPVIVKELKHGNKEVFQSLCALNSTYVPQIYHIEEADGRLVIAEEYIEGELLSDYLSTGKLSQEEWLDIARQLCEALGTLHAHIPPVIHRDIKPSNIIVNKKGRVKLIDFDSSRLYKEESEGDTRLLGTERYAPPEQYGFSQTDCRSDIYSLGVVFGMFPAFASKTRQKRWQQMVEKCTLFAPESRFQSVEAVQKEISKITGTRQRGWRISGSVSGIGLALLVAGMLLWHLSAPTQPVTEPEQPTQTSTPVTETESTAPTDIPVTSPESPTPTSASVTEDEASTPASAPVTGDVAPTPTGVPEIKEANQTTPPEWRDIENDIPAYVSLKEQIRRNNALVSYCFKDRLQERDFWLQVKWMEQQQIEFLKMELYSHRNGTQIEIEEMYYDIRNNIICIDKEYMQALEAGYYRVKVFLHNTENGHGISHAIELYVSESDVLEEPVCWLQNTTLDFYGEANATAHAVVKNDSGNRITGLLDMQQVPIDEAMYEIRHDGRVIEFSNELLLQGSALELQYFYVTGMDGSMVDVQIYNNLKTD